MKKLLLLIAIGLVCADTATTLAFESPIVGKVIQIYYEGDQSYLISFSDRELIWTGLRGDDAGRSEKDLYQISTVAKDIYFLSWTEKDGSFISLVLDFKKMHTFAAGHEGKKTWHRGGRIAE